MHAARAGPPECFRSPATADLSIPPYSVPSRVDFERADKPEKLMSRLRRAYRATESVDSGPASLRRSPLRRTEVAE